MVWFVVGNLKLSRSVTLNSTYKSEKLIVQMVLKFKASTFLF